MFIILRVYSDNATACEHSDTFISALSACAIYLEDPDCISIKIWDTTTGTIYLDYWRD